MRSNVDKAAKSITGISSGSHDPLLKYILYNVIRSKEPKCASTPVKPIAQKWAMIPVTDIPNHATP